MSSRARKLGPAVLLVASASVLPTRAGASTRCAHVAEAPTAPCALIAVELGEDNTHGPAGYAAVASVIMNRATSGLWRIEHEALRGRGAQKGVDVDRVIRQPGQFWSVHEPAFHAAMQFPISGETLDEFSAEEYRRAAKVAEAHFAGRARDTTHGALFFFEDRIPDTPWGEDAIRRLVMERKQPVGYRDQLAHNNVFWGPVS